MVKQRLGGPYTISILECSLYYYDIRISTHLSTFQRWSELRLGITQPDSTLGRDANLIFRIVMGSTVLENMVNYLRYVQPFGRKFEIPCTIWNLCSQCEKVLLSAATIIQGFGYDPKTSHFWKPTMQSDVVSGWSSYHNLQRCDGAVYFLEGQNRLVC